jgi:truncated hemoglobin YjbI
MARDQGLYTAAGGRHRISRVAKIFYDKVYDHPWLKLYFAKVPQQHVENQQTDFMSAAFGGPNTYCGRLPTFAHEHILRSRPRWWCIKQALGRSRMCLVDDSRQTSLWIAAERL